MRRIFASHRLLLTFIFILFLTLNIGLIITPIEQTLNPDSPIKTFEDGLWWAFTTVTAVGYGDMYPITSIGRVIGVFLMTTGIISFGIAIGLVTVNLLRNEQQFYWRRTTERFDRLEERLERLEQQQMYNFRESEGKKPSKNSPK